MGGGKSVPEKYMLSQTHRDVYFFKYKHVGFNFFGQLLCDIKTDTIQIAL